MREILFRGKRKDNGEWVEGYLFHQQQDGGLDVCIGCDPITANDYSEINNEYYRVIPKTVGEFTGKQDIDDNRTFQDDILAFDNGAGYIHKGVVKWDGDDCGYYIDVDGFPIRFNAILRWGGKVVGNIHDSPEMVSL